MAKRLWLTILASLITISSLFFVFGTADYELAYGQQEQDRVSSIDIKQEMNLTLGSPLYSEKFTVPKTANDNLTTPEFSFSGQGTLNGIKITATGNGHSLQREDGTVSVTNGRALFTSENGSASYSFEEILKMKDNVVRHHGAAFFDANATGNLEFLNSIIGVYKSVIDEEGRGTFAMWRLDE